MPNGGFESKQTIERELAFFKKQNPKIEVEYEILSWSRAWFQLMQAIKEKSGPDIIQIGTTWIGTLGYLGAVHKLDKRVRPKEQFCSYFPQHLPFFRPPLGAAVVLRRQGAFLQERRPKEGGRQSAGHKHLGFVQTGVR